LGAEVSSVAPRPPFNLNQVFYSIQGEGYWTGTPCVFVRFAGCDRAAPCDFCDTDHSPKLVVDKLGDLVDLCWKALPPDSPFPDHLVLTGGEPWLQLSSKALVDLHHAVLPHGTMIHIETNGYCMSFEHGLGNWPWLWVTWSPKGADRFMLRQRPYPVHELKLVVDRQCQPITWEDMDKFEDLFRGVEPYPHLWLQPAWRGLEMYKGLEKTYTNYERVMQLLAQRPNWRLSQQTHKLASVTGVVELP